MKLIVTGHIKYYKLSDILYVNVPYWPEFRVKLYAKSYVNDPLICGYIPEFLEYHEKQEAMKKNKMLIEGTDIAVRDRTFFYNVVNTVYPYSVSR